MHRIAKLLLQGLAAVLPLALTLYIFFWLVTKIEGVTKPVVLWFISTEYYFPGLGILVAIPLLIATGLIMNAYGIRYVFRLGDKLLARTPLVKSVYGAIQDIMRVFNLSKNKDLQTVVSLDVGNNTHLIGFVTGARTGKRLFPEEGDAEQMVGVYLPMSYQVGGYTVYVPKDRLRPLDISVEEAMRVVITGGTPSTGKDGDRQTG